MWSASAQPASLLNGLERTTWYFAEGSCATTDRETLEFLNPGSRTALVLTMLVRADGRRVYAVTDVDPRSRGTLDASFAAGYGDLLAAIVRSSEPIVAERTVYHGSADEEGTGAALSVGQASTAPYWYLPRTRINADEQERIALLNPYPFTVDAVVSFVRHGRLQKAANLAVGPVSVIGVQAPDGATSATVASASKSGGLVVEERTIYGDGRGYTVLPGLTTLSDDVYLQHAGAGGGADTLMVFNPNRVPAALSLTPVASPSARVRRVVVPALGQLAVALRGGDLGSNVALHVHSSPAVATSYEGRLPRSGEASLARTYRGSVVGSPAGAARIHELAEGDTRQNSSGPRETLYLANVNAHSTQVSIRMLSTRSRVTSKQLSLRAAASVALDINGWSPAGQHGLIVTSELPILVTRTIDFNESADRLMSSGVTG